jgi:hypothetical protein
MNRWNSSPSSSRAATIVGAGALEKFSQESALGIVGLVLGAWLVYVGHPFFGIPIAVLGLPIWGGA